MMTLFAALSAGAKICLLCNLPIFLFSAFSKRLGSCLYKCGCIVKVYILMSTIHKNSFYQSLRVCTKTPSFLLHRLQYVWSANLPSWSAERRFESRLRHFHFEFFVPFPFRATQLSQCKWNQARPFTCSYRCFRPQILLIIQSHIYL